MSAPQTEITFTVGGVVSAQYSVEPGDYLIGRDPSCALRVAAESVSARHARLTVRYDQVQIEDLDSTHGTLVDGRAIAALTRLRPGQKVQLGEALLEIHFAFDSLQETELATAPGMTAPPQERITLPPEFTGKKLAIGDMVGRGGMGAILAAREATIGRKVAMKVMLDGANNDHLNRFITEAKITGQLEHPSIVPIYELGADEHERVFYTMKFVNGITLREVLEKQAAGVEEMNRRFPLSTLLTIFQKACDALAFAHNRGIIHRDLKPEHIMIGDFGEVLVMDWGLAKRFRRGPDTVGGPQKPSEPKSLPALGMGATFETPQSPLPADTFRTQLGTIMGTPQYMAPEQARGEVDQLDPRTDIYALGAILFHILYLQPYVNGPSVQAIVEKVKVGTIEWAPGTKGRSISESLAAVCRHALAFDAAQRYQTVETLQRDLAAYQNGFATLAEKAGAWKHFTLLVRRNIATTVGIAAVLLVGTIFGTKALVEGRRAEAALTDLKKTAPTLLALAESEASFQRFDSALDKIEAALALDSSLKPAYWKRIWYLTGKEKWGRAISAARVAEQKDPANAEWAGIIPILQTMNALPSDEERYKSAALQDLMRFLEKVGANDTQVHFVNGSRIGHNERQLLTQRRMDQLLGPGKVDVKINGDQWIEVPLAGLPIESLEPLRGLPIESLNINGDRKIKSLEPLRGMPLRKLHCGETSVTDLSPLKGMPLEWLDIGHLDKLTDLSPLRGLPIKTLHAWDLVKVTDLQPLAGMPLEDFAVGYISDLSALRGAPLKKLKAEHASTTIDLSFLASAKIEELELDDDKIEDLTPLHGKPLRVLVISHNNVIDLSPLRGAPLTDLDVRFNPRLHNFTPLKDIPELTHLKFSKAQLPDVAVLRDCENITHFGCENERYISRKQFWAEYDERLAQLKGK